MILHALVEEGRIGGRSGDAILGGSHSGRRTGCGAINVAKYVATLEVRNDLRQPDRIGGVGEFGRIKIGEGDQWWWVCSGHDRKMERKKDVSHWCGSDTI